MWKQKIGMCVEKQYTIPTTDVICLLADIGFDAISPIWHPGIDLDSISEATVRKGLAIQSIHAPFYKSADIWSDDTAASQAAVDELLAVLEDCRRFHIPVMVVHTWIGFHYTQTPGKTGLFNLKKAVDRATAYGVKIAFENVEGEEFLFAVMDFFKDNDTVGFCWDSGHEMCYNHSQDLLAKYGDRLIMTHLNDNLGISRFDGETAPTDDLHLLPYDGIADWDYNITRLQASRKQEYLNFELGLSSHQGRHDNDIYAQMPLEQYFCEAYKRACRIAFKYASVR